MSEDGWTPTHDWIADRRWAAFTTRHECRVCGRVAFTGPGEKPPLDHCREQIGGDA